MDRENKTEKYNKLTKTFTKKSIVKKCAILNQKLKQLIKKKSILVSKLKQKEISIEDRKQWSKILIKIESEKNNLVSFLDLIEGNFMKKQAQDKRNVEKLNIEYKKRRIAFEKAVYQRKLFEKIIIYFPENYIK